MALFAYRAATSTGRTIGGTEEAGTPLELERALASRGLFPLDVTPAVAATRRRRGFHGRRADVVEAIRYLATLVEAEFPLDRALATVSRVAARQDVSEAVLAVRSRVRAGGRLGDALGEHPSFFPRIAVGMVQAGERGGHLPQALSRLATQLERELSLRARLLSASLYPAAMLAVGTVAVLVLLFYVLPRLVGILDEASAAVPASTAALLWISDAAARWWPYLLGAAAAGVVLITGTVRSDTGRASLDRALLRLPVVGPLRRRLAAARFGHALATLLGSGLPVLPALEIAAQSMGDRAVGDEVLRAREEVRAGGRLAAALGRGRAFPFVFLQMVEVGEDGARLPQMLERGAAAMEQELERRLDRLVRFAEPAMILVFGAAVAFIAMALLQAIYGINVDAF
jgi:general secretion pathway protein F